MCVMSRFTCVTRGLCIYNYKLCVRSRSTCVHRGLCIYNYKLSVRSRSTCVTRGLCIYNYKLCARSMYILCTYIQAKLSLIILITLEASICDDEVKSEEFMSGRSLWSDGVMYGGGLSGGVFIQDSGHPGVGPFQDSRHASLEFTGSPNNAVKRNDHKHGSRFFK